MGVKGAWRPSVGTLGIVVFAAVTAFLAPDRFALWIFAAAFGVVTFGILLLDPEKPGFEAVVILVVGGFLVFALGASAFPRDALSSWRKMSDIDFPMVRFVWIGPAMIIGGVLWAIWLCLSRAVKALSRKESNNAFETGSAKKGRAAQRER
jgi:uncharacterized membrane protein YedE/YeeE